MLAWAAMLASIQQAQKSIFLESFTLADEKYTQNFFQTLREKAKAGVTVKIVADRVGHFWLGWLDKKQMEESGAEVVFYNRWLSRNHRKVLIVDESTAFIGGVELRGKDATWLDLHLRFTGKLVTHLVHSFVRIYQLAGGRDPKIKLLAKKPMTSRREVIYKAKIWLMEHWPIHGKTLLRDYYEKKIAEAKGSIVIVTPYFTPHRWLMRSLKAAVKRGVKVEIMMPFKTDVAISNFANYVFARILSDDINFFLLPEMIHAKVLLIDNREGLVGSNNIDAQSFDFNLEAGLVFQQKDMIGDLREILEKWKKSSIAIDKINKPWRWYHSLFGFFVKLLQPIL